MDRSTLLELYRHVDALDAPAFAAAFVERGSMTFGNQPPAQGRDAIRRGLEAFFVLLDGMTHEVLGLWPFDDGFAMEARVHYRVKGVAEPVAVSGATLLRTEGDRLVDVRVYYDLAPVFAAAQGARVPEHPEGEVQVEHHQRGDHRGAFVVERGGETLAEMTYSMAGDHLMLIDHTEVGDALRGRGVARRLLDRAVAFAREHHHQVIPVCPYASAQFARDPSIRDVLSPRPGAR
jgi:hypothetical protein